MCFFFACCLQLTLPGIWMSVSEGASRCGGKLNAADQKKRSKRRQVEIDAFRRVYGCWREAHLTMSGECRLRETARASCSGWDTIACLPAWVTANSKASVSCLNAPPTHTPHTPLPLPQLPVYNCSQMFTAAKFHFLLPNPIAHYPVHCIRALIFPFSSSEEERSACMINPLYSNK